MNKFLLYFIVYSFFTFSCGDSNETNKSNIDQEFISKNVLRINIGTEPPTLDWSKSRDSTSYLILINIMDGLTRFSDELKIEPALAESWEVSEDGKRYTFKMRKGVRWSDGVPLRSYDFEYSWKRILNPNTGADYAYFLFDIVNAREYNTGKIKDPDQLGIKVLDNNTLEITLKRSAAYFPSLLTFMSTFPMRKDIVEKYDLKWTEPGNIVTLGAFNLKSWQHHVKLSISKNPSYWGKKPKLNAVEMIMNENPSSTLALYESGELDYIDGRGIPLLEIPRLRLSSEFSTEPQFRGNYIGFNTKKPPFDNTLVRKAFSAAIDRVSLIELIQGLGIPSTSWIPKGMLAYNENIGIKFDPELAKKLLEQSGYNNMNNLPKITFLYPDVSFNRIIAESLQSMWKNFLGVEIELVNQEWKVYLSTLTTDPPHLYRAGWSADFPDPHNFMNLFGCNSGNNHTGWCNPVFDDLINKASAESNEAKRITLYDEAQKILTESDVPIACMYNSIQQTMKKPYVKGLGQNPLGLIYLNNIYFSETQAAVNQ